MDIGKVVKIGDRPMEPIVLPQAEPLRPQPQHEPEVEKPRKKVKEKERV